MKLTTKSAKQIKEVPYGVYLWQMPNGSYVADDADHYLMIASMEGDQEKMKLLAQAAADFGVDVGMPCFFSGNRIVSDEEYEEQRLRLKFGLTPDKWDIASVNEDRQSVNRRR